MARRPAFRRYGMAVGSTALAVLVIWVLRPLPTPLPGLVMLITVLGSTAYGGLGPGLLATACALFVLHALVLPPTYLQTLPLTHGLRLGIFGVVACAGSLLLALARRITAQLQRVNAELEARVAERTTTLRQAHTALAASEARYRELFENATDIVYTHDLQGIFTSVNKAAERLSGYTQAEALQMHIAQVVVPEHVALANQVTARQLAGETVPPYELEILTKEGRRVPLEVHTRLLTHEGHPIGIQGIARDITERQRAAEALRRSEEHFRLLIENALDIIILLNGDGTVRYQSPSAERLLGYQPAEAVGTSGFAFIHPDDLPQVVDIFTAIFHQPGIMLPIEMRVQHKDGSWHVI